MFEKEDYTVSMTKEKTLKMERIMILHETKDEQGNYDDFQTLTLMPNFSGESAENFSEPFFAFADSYDDDEDELLEDDNLDDMEENDFDEDEEEDEDDEDEDDDEDDDDYDDDDDDYDDDDDDDDDDSYDDEDFDFEDN